jgi:hypothetical protein
MTTAETVETTDSWPLKKILKHIIFPKPEGSPKAGKKEILIRVAIGCAFGLFALTRILGNKSETEVNAAPIAQEALDEPQRIARGFRAKMRQGHVCEMLADNIDSIAESASPENVRYLQIEKMVDSAARAGCI